MQTINAAIAAVTVFPTRARVTRRGRVHLAPGEETLALDGLSPWIIEDSVRANGRGVGAKILQAEVTTEFVVQPPEQVIVDLQKQLVELQDKDKVLVDEEAASAARLDFLTKLRESSSQTLARGLAFGNTTLERVQAVLEFTARELDSANARRRELAIQRRDLKREIAAAQARLDQVQKVDTNRRRGIRVSVQAEQETDLDLEVTYMVGGAAWKPLYDVRLGGEALAVTYLASVTQTSGEDWLGTDLTLSTARPMEGAEIPELDPWYIDARVPQPIPPPSPRAMAAGGPMRMAVAAAPMPEAAPSATMMAEVESSGAAVTYHIARPVKIPSDGAPHRTIVTVLDLKSALDYITAPKLAEQAFLRAKTRNTSPYLFLPGAANVFHENDLVGATVFETIAPNQEFEVHLGADDRIKVERELVERTVDKTLIGNTRRLFFNYKITLTNLLTTPARVTVLDQIPKSRNEELKVKLRDANPRPTEQDDMNILKWELELKPQEKREITFGFAIEHPREMRLIGISE